MTRPAKTVPAPRAAMPDAEPNRYLAKFKASLVKRWSHTRMETLYEQLDLAIYLWALDRTAEALEILRSTTDAFPVPPLSSGGVNYNLWSPIVSTNALEARICRLSGDAPAAAAPTSRLLADPGLADNPSYIAGKVTDAPADFSKAAADPSMKWSCHRFSRTLTTLFLLSELAAAGHEFSAYYDPQDVENLITTGQTALATRLSLA